MHHESEDRYRTLFETSPDGIVLTDLQGTILMANTAAARIHGYEQGEELIGANVCEVVRPEDQARAGKTIQEALAIGHVRNAEHQLLRRDTTVFAELNLSVIKDKHGNSTALIGVVRDVTERRRLEEQLRYQALHDTLTDLPNRMLLYNRLEHALLSAQREGTSVALLLLDLDGFKETNDRFGHDYGDRVLQQAAPRLQSVLRASDTVARLGGDEFAVVLREADEQGAIEVGRKLLKVLAAPLTVGEQTVVIGASIGIAVYPEHGEEGKTLLRSADHAMYAAKRGKLGYAVYQPGVHETLKGQT